MHSIEVRYRLEDRCFYSVSWNMCKKYLNEFRHVLCEILRPCIKIFFLPQLLYFFGHISFSTNICKKYGKINWKKKYIKKKRCKKNVKIIDITLPFSSSSTYFPTLIIYHIVGEEYSRTPRITPFLQTPNQEKNRWMKLPPYSYCIFQAIERR